MLTLLLQQRYRPYSCRSMVRVGENEFQATLCCNGVRIGTVRSSLDPKYRKGSDVDATLLMDFDNSQYIEDFIAFRDRALASAGRKDAETFTVELMLNMVRGHLEDKKIHSLVRKGSVVFGRASDEINAYTVVDGPFTEELAMMLRKQVPDLSWIANEDIGATILRRKKSQVQSLH